MRVSNYAIERARDAAIEQKTKEVNAFTEELRALCRKYGLTLIAQGYEGGAELSVDHGWPLAKSDRFSPYAAFPDE